MTKFNRDKLTGGIMVAIIFGIPVTIFFGPYALSVFVVTLVVSLLLKKDIPPKTHGLEKPDDELLVVILPTIDNKNSG